MDGVEQNAKDIDATNWTAQARDRKTYGGQSHLYQPVLLVFIKITKSGNSNYIP